MSDEKKKLLMFLRGLSEKGQGIVEFGVVVAFCVAIGYFMQTVGFASALNDIFGTAASAEFAPADIVAGETKVEGNIAAVDSIGGGSSSSDSGGNPNPPADPPANPPADPPADPPANPPANPPADPPGIPAGGQTGEESGKLSPLAYYEKLSYYKNLINVDNDSIIKNNYRASGDINILGVDEGTLINIINNNLLKEPSNSLKWSDIQWGTPLVNDSYMWMNVKSACESKGSTSTISPKQVWDKFESYKAMRVTDDSVFKEYEENDYALMKLGRENFLGFIKYSDWWPPTPNSNFKWEDINDQSDWRWVKLKNLYYDSGN